MVDELERIRAALRELGRDLLLSRLQPGLARFEIEQRLSESGLEVPRNYVELYSWCDGTLWQKGDKLDDIQFFPGFYFPRLDEAVTNYETFRADTRWKEGWLPVFANGGGDFYVADLEQATDEDAPIIGFILDQPEHPIEYEGIAEMVATLDACFAENAFFVDDRGYLEIDDERHARIARRHNPGVAYWRE